MQYADNTDTTNSFGMKSVPLKGDGNNMFGLPNTYANSMDTSEPTVESRPTTKNRKFSPTLAISSTTNYQTRRVSSPSVPSSSSQLSPRYPIRRTGSQPIMTKDFVPIDMPFSKKNPAPSSSSSTTTNSYGYPGNSTPPSSLNSTMRGTFSTIVQSQNSMMGTMPRQRLGSPISFARPESITNISETTPGWEGIDDMVEFWRGGILWPHLEMGQDVFTAKITRKHRNLIVSEEWPSVLGCYSLFQTIHKASNFSAKLSRIMCTIEFVHDVSTDNFLNKLYSKEWKGYWAAEVDFSRYSLVITPDVISEEGVKRPVLAGFVIPKD
eukprot:TRINITY_DN1751_c0_g2_i7.p1 TRINITY_DN1751_c0_g2~~TRINITY_DN1751_c0_g2_i7.p1  ORF type:complete len:324 (-),score=43.06 TRINITY_DN1751_c0_g2_i7:222-1193(-)